MQLLAEVHCNNQTRVLNSNREYSVGQGLAKMRMSLRTNECRRRAAVCAEKALSTLEQEARRTFAELAEQWRALAEQAEYLEGYH
jgi:hypothetical protein